MTISGVVPTPTFDITKPETMDNWKESCKSPGLWADVRGARFRFTLPPDSVCELSADYLKENLEQWDKMVRTNKL